MNAATPGPLRVRFGDCEAGWITMYLHVGEQIWPVQCSCHYDPAADLLVRLESLVAGAAEGRWTVNEERGPLVHFDVSRPDTQAQGDSEDLLLTVTCTDGWGLPGQRIALIPLGHEPTLVDSIAPQIAPQMALQIPLTRRELVSTFYQSFRAFAESPHYLPQQWQHYLVRDRVEELTGESAECWVESALPLDRRGLQKALWLCMPILTKTQLLDSEHLGTAQEYSELTGKPWQPGNGLPSFEFVAEWPRLQGAASKRAYLLELLAEPSFYGYGGEPWPKMHSEIVAAHLA